MENSKKTNRIRNQLKIMEGILTEMDQEEESETQREFQDIKERLSKFEETLEEVKRAII